MVKHDIGIFLQMCRPPSQDDYQNFEFMLPCFWIFWKKLETSMETKYYIFKSY